MSELVNDQEKAQWLEKAKTIASEKGMEWKEGVWKKSVIKEFGNSIDFPTKKSGGTVHLFYQMILLPDGLIPFQSDVWNWQIQIRDKLGYENNNNKLLGFGRYFDDPEKAIEEVNRVLSEWDPTLFESLEMAAASIRIEAEKFKKLLERMEPPRSGKLISEKHKDSLPPQPLIKGKEKDLRVEIRPEDKGEMAVFLSKVGEKKIQVIKAVREIFGMDLKEAKDLVDRASINLIEGISEKKAEEIKKALEGIGAEIEIRKVP